MNYHNVVYKIKELLEKNKIWYETFEHHAVKTSEEAAKVRPEYSLKQGAKAMIIRTKKNSVKKFVMLVLPGNRRFNNDKVKTFLQVKDIRFATSEEVNQITKGVEIGGIPPFGKIFGIDVIVDPNLLENKNIIFNAGDRRYSIAMKTDDYLKLNKPKIGDIT